MKNNQFEKLVEQHKEKSFGGQFFSCVYVRDMRSEIAKEHKELNIIKISKFQAQVIFEDYISLNNGTQHVQDLNITVNRDPDYVFPYTWDIEGFLCTLKKDNSKKYVAIKFNEEKQNIRTLIESIYIDADGNQYTEKEIENMMTPSALKSKHGEYGRAGKLELTGKFKMLSWDKIAALKIGKSIYVDPILNNKIKGLVAA
jgi:hypothetical protein